MVLVHWPTIALLCYFFLRKDFGFQVFFFKSVLAEKLGKVCLPNASAPPKRLAFVREYERALTCKMTPMVFSFLGATNRDSHAPVKYRIPKMEASLDNFCLLHFSANGRTCSRTSSWNHIFWFSGKFNRMNLLLLNSPGNWQLDMGKGTL